MKVSAHVPPPPTLTYDITGLSRMEYHALRYGIQELLHEIRRNVTHQYMRELIDAAASLSSNLPGEPT